MRRKIRALAFALGVLAPAAAVAAGPGGATELVPHRALFVVKLAGPSAVIESARGLAATEIRRTCDGWRYSQRYELEIVSAGGEESHTTFSLDARESLDGRVYSFHSTTDYGEGEPVTMIGRAEGGPAGGVVRYTEPARLTRDLPPGIGFAVGSVVQMLSAAAAGEDQFRMPWFVGSGPDEPLLISSLIFPAEAAKPSDAPLLQGRRWRFVSGFYADPKEASPLYEGEETIAETGVMVEALYRYDGYGLKLKLQRAEPVPLPHC